MAINPMPTPIDYLGQMGITPQSPTQALLEGLQLGSVFQEQRKAREQAQLAEQYKADASAYYANPTPQGALELAAKYPEQGTAFMQEYRALNQEQRKNEFNRAAKALSAVSSGNFDVAKSIIDNEIRAAAEAGGDVAGLEQIKTAIDANPDGAYASIMHMLAAMDPKATADIADALNKAGVGGAQEGNRFLTAEEIAAKPGLDRNRAYQIDLKTGKVTAVGGGGVNVTVGGEQETEFAKQTGKDFAKQFSALSTIGQQAARSSIRINKLDQAFRSADVKTGAEGVISTALSRFGIDVPGATQYQQIDALIAALIPLQRPEGSGTTSDKDIENFKRALPQLLGTKEGQLQIIQDMKAVADYDMKAGEIANQARSGQITPIEAQKRLGELVNPLEKYAIGGGAPPTVSGAVTMPPDDVNFNNPLLQQFQQ